MLPFQYIFRQTAVALCAGACLMLAPQAAQAQIVLNQPLEVIFNSDTQSVLPNVSATFSGTITNNTSSALYINGDTPDTNLSGLTTDDTPFQDTFVNSSPVLLAAGQTYALTNFFTITDADAAAGTYQGHFNVFGGSTPTSSSVNGYQLFNVQVPQAVPEASTSVSLGVLLLGGVAALLVRRRRNAC